MLGFGVTVDALADHPQRVDVQTGVGLVEDRDLRLEQPQLQDLVALLLTTGEAFVDTALAEGLIDVEVLHRRFDFFDPVPQLGRLAADRGGGRAQEVRHRHTGHLDRVLHRQEQARRGRARRCSSSSTFCAVERDRPGGDGVLGVARRWRRTASTCRIRWVPSRACVSPDFTVRLTPLRIGTASLSGVKTEARAGL